MDLNTVETIENEDPSEETLKLTTRRKEITKHGNYRYIEKIQPSKNTESRTKELSYSKEKTSYCGEEWKE